MNAGGLLLAGLGVAAGVALYAWRSGNAARASGRPMARSVQEGLERAKKGKVKKRVVVAFLAQGDPASDVVLHLLAKDEGLDARLRGYELVRIDSPKDDLDVAAVVAQKYGVEGLSVPTVLVLESDGKKAAEVKPAELAGEHKARERIYALLAV